LLEEVNVAGTRNVIEACRRCGVRRLVYTSSVHAFAEPPSGRVIDEATPISAALATGDYGKSKANATLEVLEAARSGMEAVVVCPAAIIGPYDFASSRMGRFLSYLERWRVYGLPDGGYNFVDVRDVAQAEIAAAERGKSGEIYIASGERVELDELLASAQKAVGRAFFAFRLPMWLCRVGAAFGTLLYWLTGKEPLLTGESLEIIRSNSSVSCAKAEREISYYHRPVAQTLLDTLSWLRARGNGPDPATG
jgi:nucleoside-diphosphate-sugar epimerase